jgi:hypothetical protein
VHRADAPALHDCLVRNCSAQELTAVCAGTHGGLLAATACGRPHGDSTAQEDATSKSVKDQIVKEKSLKYLMLGASLPLSNPMPASVRLLRRIFMSIAGAGPGNVAIWQQRDNIATRVSIFDAT